MPGMLARTPIVFGAVGVSQRFTVAQRFLTGLAATAGAGARRSGAASSGSEQAESGRASAPS